MPSLRLSLLWHLHQPVYRHPESGEFILPWVRLHATRAYYDMPKVLGEFEGARAVINVVPSLLAQLDEYAQGRARDRFLDLTRRPADTLGAAEREFLLRNFFMVDWETCVRPLPRYWELLHKRGRDVIGVDLMPVALGFSVQELRDLQVLFNLAWMGFRAEEEEEVVRALKAKGRDFTESEKLALLDAQQRIVQRVMPALAEVAASGQAELTVTPFYHPILPLLIDSEAAHRAMPHATLPPRFAFPQDAREQVRRALDFAEARLGVRPRGMWPAEGSVSPEALEVLASEGVRWCASDEGVLLRSRPNRDRREGAIHRPYRARAGAGEIAMVFRDRGLSDLIGFTYSKNRAEDALDDLWKHFQNIAREAGGRGTPLLTLALDGENPWEHYPNSGRDFLRGLYERLAAREGDVEPVNAGAWLEANPPRDAIEEIHSGSWIDANYRIWIGHSEDNQAWSLLREARQALAERERQVAAGAVEDRGECAAAREALLVAEGSDWFWWYGDDFTTDSAAEFDALFRGYVRDAFRALGVPAPTRLDSPISRQALAQAPAASAPPPLEPQGFIRPHVDGRSRSYLEWTGAAVYAPNEAQGSMFRGEGLFRCLYFGFDPQQFFLRLDPVLGADTVRQQASGLRIAISVAGTRREVEIAFEGEEPRPRHKYEGTPGAGAFLGRAAFRDIVEAALPFEPLGMGPGARVTFTVQVMREGIEVERFPRHGQLVFHVPDADFERKNWKV